MKTKMTVPQQHRQWSRERSGRYSKHYPCELCGVSAGEKYASDDRCNEMGVGVVLHWKCADVLALLPMDAAKSVLDAASANPSIRFITKLLEMERGGRAGCISLRFCRRGAGPLTGVYRNAEAGLESDPDLPWSVVCEKHHTLICTTSRAMAESTSTDTRNFCDDCREADTAIGQRAWGGK